ncbi:MAG: 50S ribosomal protein L29 [Nanoarchaeota archaeon]
MSIIKRNELKTLSKASIDEKMSELGKELMKLNAQRAVGTTIENPGKIKLLKRTIAKLKTAQKNKSVEKTDKEEENK